MSYAITDRLAYPPILFKDVYVPPDPKEKECDFVTKQLFEVLRHYVIPLSRQRESIAERFRELLQCWKEDVGLLSSVTEMAMHPAYQQIIGLGRSVVPLILRELEKEPDHWFWALKAITGADPVKPAQRGRVKDMTDAWLRWGREEGLL